MPPRPTYILGLCYFGQHDSSAALLKDGKLVAMQGSPDRRFPDLSIAHCLKEAGISIANIDRAAFFWQPWRGVPIRIAYALRGLPYSLGLAGKNVGVLSDLLRAERTFRTQTGYKGPFEHIPHELCHAAHSYFDSGFEKAAIVTADGTGETDTCWIGTAGTDGFKRLDHVRWPHSLGHTYAALTEYLGFQSFRNENKVMQLSLEGRPEYLEIFRKIIRDEGELFSIDLSYMNYPFSRAPRYGARLVQTLGPARTRQRGRTSLGYEPLTDRHKNIAASLQARLEEVLLKLVAYAVRESGSSNVCLGGGVMHNTLAVEKIKQSGIARITSSEVGPRWNIYVPKEPGDIGAALGAALVAHHKLSY